MSKMVVYHGSYTMVKEPYVKYGHYTKDFGKGFYCTIIKEQAETDFIDGIITRDQFWIMAKFKYPTHQINFCSDEAISCLKYRDCLEVLK